jgi:uncharacterized protein YbjT (DUF2867 family)
MRTALIVGATGLVGRACLLKLLENDQYSRVITLSRKNVPVKHSKLHQVLVDFDNLENYKQEIVGDDVFCCLGTTITDAGSQTNFRKVDYDYPLQVVKLALQNGASQFLLVSAMGADPNASIFYNKVKGEAEKAIGVLGYPVFKIFRPSLLLGSRTKVRIGEGIARFVMRLFDFLFILGPLKNYRAIRATIVAHAMVYAAFSGGKGNLVYTNFELHGMGKMPIIRPDLPFGEKPLLPRWRDLWRL